MRGRIAGRAIAALALVALATGCSTPSPSASDRPTTASPTPTGAAHGSSVSWARAYPTLASLTEDADVVVRGTVSGQQHLVVENGMPHTDSPLTATAWLKGSTARTVVVRQTGGVVDGVQVHTEDAPLLRPGDDEILFLRHAGRSELGDVYVTLSGPSGRLRVEAGTVRVYPGTSLTEGLPSTVGAATARIRSHATTGSSR